ncbi:MAG: RNA polymerase factor sigma-54 [Tannerella sp.]|jgi:RNA polymerase sigma-54 factor|nr:RNA polymerase factor sigma-54 [Tannerella sp.]
MALKQQQQLKQQQRLSPQQIQTIRMLELPALEIEERIKHELEENPALEEGKEHSDEQESDFDSEENNADAQDPNEDLSLGDYMNEDDIPDYKLAEMSSKEERKESVPFSNEQSLSDYLLQQLQLSELSERDEKIGEYIIGNIDDDGYLRRHLNAIADDIAFQLGEDINDQELYNILCLIQDFDPPGIGARNLQECLILQLKKRNETVEAVPAAKILTDFFEEFTHKHFDKIQKSLDIDEEQMKAAIQEITSLNPKPGSNWDDSMTTIMNRITPDFTVETLNGEITLTLNSRGVPDLRINREYSDMLKDYAGNKANQTSDMRDAVLFVKQKLDAAQGFIDAVRQRQETLRRTMEAIIVLQKEFFFTGDESKLQPMILKDVAEKTGYDISTISRVSNSKYVQTNFGIYPLKFFFSESTQTESGETISTRKIKQIIKDEIDVENKKKPVTDEELTNILNSKGFLIARRTVAKYREQLGIAVARLRKEM